METVRLNSYQVAPIDRCHRARAVILRKSAVSSRRPFAVDVLLVGPGMNATDQVMERRAVDVARYQLWDGLR
jgi:hypothetical protein